MRTTPLRAGLVLATVTALSLAGTSTAAPSRPQSAVGDVTAGPNHVVFSAKRAAGAPSTRATGSFSGEIVLAGTRVLRFAGPITCLDVRGKDVGFFYPVTSSDPAVVAALGAGITINIATDGAGRATGLSFIPSPLPTSTDCSPAPAPVPATGRTVLRS